MISTCITKTAAGSCCQRVADRVGVLALQGAFARHVEACAAVGAEAVEIRTPDQLREVERLILPGGESTTISMMLDRNGLRKPLADRLRDGMPVFGTCAGMILLAADVVDGRSDQQGFAAIDIGVRRNGYGRQNQSFSASIDVDGFDDSLHAVFIRAPVVEWVGPGVEVLASHDGDPVLCRSGPVLVSSFHPELSTDRRLHGYFCALS